jgi:hypothetical protein
MAITDFFKRKETRMLKSEFVKMVVGYQPAFSTYTGGVYEMDMTVAAIHSFANHCSKANPKVKGSSYKNIEKQFQVFMNDTMTTSQFLYRVATIYKCENNVYIIPIYDQYQFITGWYPVSSVQSRIQSTNGVIMLTYALGGKQYAIPYNEVIHLKSHHYRNELMGDGNSPLYSTLSLIDTQNQGIMNGIQQSNTIRFIAKLNNIFNPKDMKDERERLITDNLSNTNTGGVLLFDKKYEDIKQVESRPFIVDDKQAAYIRDNVYNYFGTNEKILQNKFTPDEWGAYYEGEVEPLLIQLSQAMTRCMFTNREISFDNFIIWEATRLQYASTDTKLNLITQLFDRGFLTHNEGLSILNLPPINNEEADKRYIRLEYGEVGKLNAVQGVEELKGEQE